MDDSKVHIPTLITTLSWWVSGDDRDLSITFPTRVSHADINRVCRYMNDKVISGNAYLWSEYNTIYTVIKGA